MHRTAKSLYDAQLARFRSSKMSIVSATRMMASQGKDDLYELLSGTAKYKGHPFARGQSAASSTAMGARRSIKGQKSSSAPLRPINVKTGRLRASLRLNVGPASSYDLSVSTKYARYILHPAGTRKMVGRGVMSWHDKNRAYPTGELTKRHRLRLRAYRDSFKKAVSRP